MIYSVDFKEMAGKVSHVNVSKYLHDLGWAEFDTKRNTVKIFQKATDDNFYQVDLPIDRKLADYNTAMYRAIEDIALSVGKSVEQVLLELLNPLSDILRVRILDKSTEMGSILVEDALNLYENTKKLLTAAAMDIISPKLIHVGRPDSKVQEFVNNCRFGQTEIGSYVVSVVCPFGSIQDNVYTQLTLFSEEDECAQSLTRQVTNKLLTSIRKVRASIDNGSFEETILDDRNPIKISANFLEALSEISIYKEGSETEITVKWAPTISKNILDFNKVTLSHDYYEPIYSIVQKIKNSVIEESVYIGRVSALKAADDAKRRESGVATLVYLTETAQRATASVGLNKDDYDSAIEAHRNGKTVRITGTLSGQKHKRIDYTRFEVLD